MRSNAPERHPGVAAFLAAQPAAARAELERLRGMIFRIAAETPGVGELSEGLKWGEPSYTPAKPRVGSSVRLATAGGKVALHFICHTGLIDRFRELYPLALVYQGNRSMLLEAGSKADEAALGHCIAMALTYHLAKRKN